MTEKQPNLTSGRRLARNVLWNLLGTGAPLLVAIVAIPMLIEGLGLARFGVLTIAWMVVGYFSLFDLGLGRALTKLVAEKLGKEQDDDIPSLIWTAMSLMVALGVLGAIIVAALTPLLVGSVLKIPVELQPETLTAFYLLAISILIVICSTGLRGILEAHQRFALVNAVRIPLGIFTFLGPVAVLPFSNSLVPVVAALVAARLVSLCSYVALCLYVQPSLRRSAYIRRTMIRPLVSFGGWMTVSNIIGPIMVYMDRFFIGAVVSMAAVAYYATPYEIITKLWIIPGALMGVLFPAFSTVFASDRPRTALLFERAIHYIYVLLFPLIFIIVVLAPEGLNLWLGSEFANNSALVLQLLAVGVFINSLARIPHGLVQSAGRPDLIAKTHIVELPFYLWALWFALPVYGVEGAAVVWVLRISVDTVVFFLVARSLLPEVRSAINHLARLMILAVGVLFLALMVTDLVMKMIFLFLILLCFTIIAWFKILTEDERAMIAQMSRRYFPIIG